ncbi:hypothetical protein LEMLEM_LOCUS16643, partial [Lemmus lemmus]
MEVAQCPVLWSAPLEFAVSGLLWPGLLAFICFCKSWSGSPLAEVPVLELNCLLWWRSPTLDLVAGSIVMYPCPRTRFAPVFCSWWSLFLCVLGIWFSP